MTDAQIEKAEMDLYDGENMYEFYRAGKKLSASKERRRKELKCMSMINSILCYDWATRLQECTPQKVLEEEQNKYHSYLDQYVQQLGKERVLELIQEQLNSIAGVKVNVFTDSEGCSYNSIIYKEA